MKAILTFFITGILFFSFFITAWGSEESRMKGTHQAYLDVATGHKYIRNENGTYTEFSSKGRLFRSDVPSNLPLIVSRKTILAIPEDSCLVYEKNEFGSIEKQILNSSETHPEGYVCKGVLVSLRAPDPGSMETGLGYSKKPSTIQFEKGRFTAIGPAYYDTRTGHKYVRNSDSTYIEYSRRGELFRGNVPDDLPLLTSGRSIVALEPDDFFVYERLSGSRMLTRVLSVMEPHPDGWHLKDVLSSVR